MKDKISEKTKGPNLLKKKKCAQLIFIKQKIHVYMTIRQKTEDKLERKGEDENSKAGRITAIAILFSIC